MLYKWQNNKNIFQRGDIGVWELSGVYVSVGDWENDLSCKSARVNFEAKELELNHKLEDS